MTMSEVRSILGVPFEPWKITMEKESWRYSKSPGDKSYRIRVIVFENEKVISVKHKFYVD